MPARRRARIIARFGTSEDSEPGTSRLCEVCADVSLMSGAAIMLMSGEMPAGLCATDGVSALIEELQYTLGEGPCVDAYREDRPVLEPDLADPVIPRWSAFTPPALAAGALAVFGFPLRAGAVRLGALNLYRDRRGVLTGDQHADALVLAEVTALAVLTKQARAPEGEVGVDIELRLVVHEAAGMIAAQLQVTVAEALLRLRAHAFATDRLISDVADDVVANRLRLDDPHRDQSPPA